MVGPCAFVGAWAIAGSRTARYSAVEDAISRLAAVHAPTRTLMTTGFVLFGLGVPAFAVALRSVLPGKAWFAATATGVCTLAVAALPLDAGVDGLHGLSAVLGYVTLATTPLLAADPLARRGLHRSARLSWAAGATSAVLLVASTLGPWHGLFQRAGLAVVDVWICAMSVAICFHPPLSRPMAAPPA